MFHHILITVLLASFLAFLPAQCLPAPMGTFATNSVGFVHTYTDGYLVEVVLRSPNVAVPPQCGWPLIVLVHGGGGSKAVVAATADNLAARGYTTLAYDVRGQGPSMALNNPVVYGKTLKGIRELLDLFEVMEAAEAAYPTRIDFTRIGVTGYSQGGRHSWMAAVNSGRLPPPNPWRVAPFPIISCAVPKDAAGPGYGLSSGLALGHRRIEKMFNAAGGGTHYEPMEQAQARAFVLADDLVGLANLTHEPTLDPNVLLPACQVPVFAHISYDDYKISSNAILGSWQLLPTALPRRLMGGTGGHDSPNNLHDNALFAKVRLLWFDRWLKDSMNGVTQTNNARLSVTPDDIATYQDPTTLRDFRWMDDVPSASTITRSFYFDAAGQLSATAPVGAGAATLAHNVPAGASIATYTAAPPSPASLIALFGMNDVAWQTAPLAQDRHLQGIAALELHVNSPDPRFQIHGVLYDVDPAGNARYVNDGIAAVRDNLPAGQNILQLPLYVQSYVFRAGHRIRIVLENLTIHRPPTGNGRQIRTVPCFQNSSVDIEFGGGTLSRIDLPIAPQTGPRLVTYPLNISVGAPQNHRFTIHSSPDFAADPYHLLLSLAGTTPGLLVPGTAVTLPLNFDPLLLEVALNPNAFPRVNFAGALDGRGSASAGVMLAGAALPPALIGTEVSAAALTSLALPTMAATNPLTIPFTQ